MHYTDPDYVVEILIRDLINKSQYILTPEGIAIDKHSLFCGKLALESGGSANVVLAALLHDIGHALLPGDESWDETSTDTEHAAIGAHWLSYWFAPAVTDPIRLHVQAKRYYCTLHPDYEKKLSVGSLQSFALQGGKMSSEELSNFQKEMYMKDALLIRKWDDTAYDDRIDLPSFDNFVGLLKANMNIA